MNRGGISILGNQVSDERTNILKRKLQSKSPKVQRKIQREIIKTEKKLRQEIASFWEESNDSQRSS